ncbi:ribonuclease HI family protein [Patescibacteria group bacterium]|nr:ribonuclease HI family protein [Patescibacteria group bacterium]MBU1029506.1 ribonuclease HI family protein [Patescibacteria group bacterium]MBU1916276.1 ribonuclease HI family protein [Patescibacteria group bacterium]
MKKLIIHTDGGARGNPGPAGIGVLIEDEAGNTVLEHSRYIGETTNNQAEYSAVIDALQHAKGLEATEVAVFLDSELVVRQLNGEYKVKDPGLAQQFLKVHNLRCAFRQVTFTHIRRELNKRADRLANEAMDRLE